MILLAQETTFRHDISISVVLQKGTREDTPQPQQNDPTPFTRGSSTLSWSAYRMEESMSRPHCRPKCIACCPLPCSPTSNASALVLSALSPCFLNVLTLAAAHHRIIAVTARQMQRALEFWYYFDRNLACYGEENTEISSCRNVALRRMLRTASTIAATHRTIHKNKRRTPS
jgi:hypothetical protein